jgi:acyl carrier protein
MVSKIIKLEPGIVEQECTNERLWDSFTHLEIVFALEDTFNISLDTGEISSMRSIETILKVLSSKIGK